MLIKDFVKTTFIDYPDKVASLVFTGGCNFRCPYCHNGDLVLRSSEFPSLLPDVVLKHLEKRKGMVDGLVITGGEPTLSSGLETFIEQVKSLGVMVKLDTNGTDPKLVESLLSKQLLDYIAMDVKHVPEQYGKATGLTNVPMEAIQASIDLLKGSDIEYEFRTTVARGLHTEDDLLAIAQHIDGAKRYYLQQYIKSPGELMSNIFTSYTREELEAVRTQVAHQTSIGTIEIRAKY